MRDEIFARAMGWTDEGGLTMKTDYRVRFRSSYAGESTYTIDGIDYDVRHLAITSIPYNVGVLEREILPAVGTVRYRDSLKFEQFPPDHVVALFPGFVGAKWNTHTWELEYNGSRPELQPTEISDYVAFRKPTEH